MFPAGRNHDTSAGIFFGSSQKVRGANKGLSEAPKSCTRKEHESATNSIAKRGQGGDFVPFRLPLAGSRDSVPCGACGNAPTAGQETNTKKAANKGAGSKVSLPATLRVRRRAPKQVLPTTMLCRAKWARPRCWACDQSCFSRKQGISRPRPQIPRALGREKCIIDAVACGFATERTTVGCI